MARGNIKVGDEVAITAIVRGRVTPDRISVTIEAAAVQAILDLGPLA